MQNLTCEEISRKLDRLGVFRTADSVATLVKQRDLSMERVENGDRRYSKYPYRVSADSFVSYLESRGFSSDEIQKNLP